MESMEEAEWSMSTATLPHDQTSPRSVEEDDDNDEVEEGWEAERRHHKGLRALLLEMDEDEDPAPRQADNDTREDEVVKGRGRRGGGGDVAVHAELRLAEERVRTLEARLLDAEETIYHLKAEKMEAWRRIEKLTRMNSEGEGGESGAEGTTNEEEESLVTRLRSQVYDLESQLDALKTQHAVELEEQMAVIREQERELLVLKDRLTDAQEYAEEMETKYDQVLTQHKQMEYEQKEEDEDDDPVKMLVHNNPKVQEPLPMSWQEELVRYPTPHFDLDSPEVQYLLSSWTKNTKKLQYLRTWLLHVALQHDRDLPPEFPMGIELPRLAPEIRDGFLTLVVPLLRTQPWREIQVHTKQYNDQFHTDLRIRVVPRRP